MTYTHKKHHRSISYAFTLVELMMTIAIIAILAGVSVVGYGQWRQSVAKKEIQSDLQMAAAAMESVKNFSTGYPADVPASFKGSKNVIVTYNKGNIRAYCLQATSITDPGLTYRIASIAKSPLPGTCNDVDLTVVADEGNSGGGSSPTNPEPEAPAPPPPPQPPVTLSDEFSGSGPLGTSETGSATWQFLNSTSSQWNRTGGFGTFTPGSANAIAMVAMAQSNNDIVAKWEGHKGAVYTRIVDNDDWYRVRVSSGSEPSSSTWCVPINPNNYQDGYNCTTTPTTIGFIVIELQKSVGGTITQLDSKKMYNESHPAFMRLTAKGSSLTVKYGPTSATANTAFTVTDSTHASSVNIGVGGPNTYANYSSINDAKIDSIYATVAP